MNYAIKGTEVAISDEIRSYIEKRLASLDKFASDAARVDVELEHQGVYNGPKYRAEFMYHEPGHELRRSEARGTTLHEAIDLAVGNLVGELSRAKKKRLHTVRRTAVKVKEYLRGWRRSL